MAKQDDYVRYTIRVPAALYERLRIAAGEKSVNAEIVIRLQASFEPGQDQKSAEEILRSIRKMIGGDIND